MKSNSRRYFIKKIGIGTAALSLGSNTISQNVLGGVAPGFSAKSYRNIMGSNEQVNIATIGVNSMGNSMRATLRVRKMQGL